MTGVSDRRLLYISNLPIQSLKVNRPLHLGILKNDAGLVLLRSALDALTQVSYILCSRSKMAKRVLLHSDEDWNVIFGRQRTRQSNPFCVLPHRHMNRTATQALHGDYYVLLSSNPIVRLSPSRMPNRPAKHFSCIALGNRVSYRLPLLGLLDVESHFRSSLGLVDFHLIRSCFHFEVSVCRGTPLVLRRHLITQT